MRLQFSWPSRWAALFALGLASMLAQARVFSVSNERGSVVARDEAQRVVWRFVLDSKSSAITPALQANGVVRLSDGRELRPDGRLVATHPLGVQKVKADAASLPSWGTWTSFGKLAAYLEPPVADSQGNAYVIADYNDLTSDLYRSSGASSTWTASPVGGESLVVYPPSMTVDSSGNITLLYGGEELYQLWVQRYTPAGGWQAPMEISNQSANFIPAYFVAADSQGNVVALVLFSNGQDLGAPYQLVSFQMSAATGTWSQPQVIATNVFPFSNHPLTLARSPNGMRLAAVYMTSGAPQGIAAQVYSADTQTWGAQMPAAGTLAATYSHGMVPIATATVDDLGRITVIAQFGKPPKTWSLWGLREAGGFWSRQQLIDWNAIPSGGEEPSALSAEIDGQGRTLSAVSSIKTDGSVAVSAIRYMPGSGWVVDSLGTGSGENSIYTPSAWVGSSGQAVVNFVTATTDGLTIASKVFDGTSWQTIPFCSGDSSLLAGVELMVTVSDGQVVLPALGSTSLMACWLTP